MQLTIKQQIYPTKDQQEVLWDLADICRRVYNLALFERHTSMNSMLQGLGTPTSKMPCRSSNKSFQRPSKSVRRPYKWCSDG
ncbi:MAG: helix-turn-helix domain-containing protein [Candidatus Hermodarchaeota archaeon]